MHASPLDVAHASRGRAANDLQVDKPAVTPFRKESATLSFDVQGLITGHAFMDGGSSA